MALAEIPIDDLDSRDLKFLETAQEQLESTGDWFVGNRIVDERVFRADETALSALKKISDAPSEVAIELDEITASLVESDHLAVVSDYEVWQEIALMSSVDIDRDVHKYQRKITQYDDHLDKGQYEPSTASCRSYAGAIAGWDDMLRPA